MRRPLGVTACAVFLVVGFGLVVPSSAAERFVHDVAGSRGVPVAGSPHALVDNYQYWKASLGSPKPVLEVQLVDSRPRRVGRAIAGGSARIDMLTGEITVQVNPEDERSTLTVWLVGKPPRSTTAVASERAPSVLSRQLGRLESTPGPYRLALRKTLQGVDPDFKLEKIVVGAGEQHNERILLVGRPSLYQMLYFYEKRINNDVQSLVPFLRLERFEGGLFETAQQLVAEGEDEFFNNTFAGNGRTCGTCHPANNNFTLDPEFIATLPATDPLFVAENPTSALNPRNTPGKRLFEAPGHLIRSHAVILENVDGFPCAFGECSDGSGACCQIDDDCTGSETTCEATGDRFVMRGVNHLLGLGATRSCTGTCSGSDGACCLADDDCDSGAVCQFEDVVRPPSERLGWGGDGAPSSGNCGDGSCLGTLKDFTVGAVRQHFTKTLNRIGCDCSVSPQPLNCDFCEPDEDQLVEIEAFSLSLGRSGSDSHSVFSLNMLETCGGNVDVCAELGRTHLKGADTCSPCHSFNGGDPAFGSANTLRRTGVERALQGQTPTTSNKLKLRPPDGGFGTGPCKTCSADPEQLCNTDYDCASEDTCVVADDQASCFPQPPFPNTVPVELAGSFGSGKFDIPSLIESADTGPFFHNSLDTMIDDVANEIEPIEFGGFTLEEAVNFYATDSFSGATDGLANMFCFNPTTGCGQPGPEFRSKNRRRSTARFLRVLNSIDNIENTLDPLIDRAIDNYTDAEIANELMELALPNFDDVVQVLEAAVPFEDSPPELHPETVTTMIKAKEHIQIALATQDAQLRLTELSNACTDLRAGRDQMAIHNSGGSLGALQCEPPE